MKYQSQFIPTDFNQVNSLLGMYRQDMAQRDAEFDSASMASAQAAAELGAIPTFDIKGRQALLDNLNKSIDEAVTKKGGDYGAAAKDLYRIVARERSNPWLQYNAQQQEAAKLAQQLGADADNLIIGDPRAVDYNKWQSATAQGQNPFNVSALSKSKLYTQVKDIASNYSKLLAEDPEFQSTLGGQYFKLFKQHGVTPETFEAFINTGPGQNIMQSVLKANPQLQGANQEIAKEVIMQGLTNAIGQSDVQYLHNRGYGAEGGDGSSGAFGVNNVRYTGTGLIPESLNDLNTSVWKDKANEVALQLAKKYGIPESELGDNPFEALRGMSAYGMQVNEDLDKNVGIPQGTGFKHVKESKYSKQSDQALKELETMLGDPASGLAMPTYGVLSTGLASGKNIREVKELQSYLDQIANTNFREDLKPLSNRDEKDLEKIEGDFTITDFSPNFKKDKAGLVLYVQGKDKDKKIVKSRLYLDPENLNTESHFVEYLNQLNPMIGIEYTYAKRGQDYLDELAGKYLPDPNVSPQVKQSIISFIENKSK